MNIQSVKNAEMEVNRAEKNLEETKEAWAENIQKPFKIGDVIDVKGYVHKGKKMRVEKIYVVHSWIGLTYRLFATGPLILKSGVESKIIGESFWNIDADSNTLKEEK